MAEPTLAERTNKSIVACDAAWAALNNTRVFSNALTFLRPAGEASALMISAMRDETIEQIQHLLGEPSRSTDANHSRVGAIVDAIMACEFRWLTFGRPGTEDY